MTKYIHHIPASGRETIAIIEDSLKELPIEDQLMIAKRFGLLGHRRGTPEHQLARQFSLPVKRVRSRIKEGLCHLYKKLSTRAATRAGRVCQALGVEPGSQRTKLTLSEVQSILEVA